MRVRRARSDDLAAIVDIYNRYVEHTPFTFDTEPATVEGRRDWLECFEDENPLLVAQVEDRVVGYAYYLPFRPRPAYAGTKECSVYVASDRHGEGIGKALYAALIEHARARGAHALIAVLAGENEASTALHVGCGFELRGHLREVGHKHGQWWDTRYYELLL
jgi:phosphinothricin acetyltransferase